MLGTSGWSSKLPSLISTTPASNIVYQTILITGLALISMLLPTAPVVTKDTIGEVRYEPLVFEQIEKPKIKKVSLKHRVAVRSVPKPKPVSNTSGWHYDCRSQRDNVKQAVYELGLGSDWQYIDFIFQHESCHDPGRLNSVGCAGLGQRCPGSTLKNVCGANAIKCQIRHFDDYAKGRYTTWRQAYNVWQKQQWW